MHRSNLLSVVLLFASFVALAEESEKSREKDSTKVGLLPAFSDLFKSRAVVVEEDQSSSAIAFASEQPSDPEVDLWHRSRLTGNWNGVRDNLVENGVSVTLGYKADNLSNVSGGINRSSSYLHNIDMVVNLDMQQLLSWGGASFLIHAMHNNGAGFSQFVGDAQVVSNIDAPKMTKVYQALYQQNFLEDDLSLAVGLYDLNSEFYVTQSALLFLNGSFGVGKEFSQTGQAGPSIFPNPAAGFRVRAQPSESWSCQFAAIDAVPGKVGTPESPAFIISSDEGGLIIGEVTYDWAGTDEGIGAGTYTIGAWLYTAGFEETYGATGSEGAPHSNANRGVYVMADQKIFAESDHGEEGLSVFSRFGAANGLYNQFDYNFAFGAVYTGLMPGRGEDRLGLALTQAHNANAYREYMFVAGTPVTNAEVTLELTYRAQLTPWLALQPDLQYIVHPAAEVGLENATTFGTRIELGF